MLLNLTLFPDSAGSREPPESRRALPDDVSLIFSSGSLRCQRLEEFVSVLVLLMSDSGSRNDIRRTLALCSPHLALLPPGPLSSAMLGPSFNGICPGPAAAPFMKQNIYEVHTQRSQLVFSFKYPFFSFVPLLLGTFQHEIDNLCPLLFREISMTFLFSLSFLLPHSSKTSWHGLVRLRQPFINMTAQVKKGSVPVGKSISDDSPDTKSQLVEAELERLSSQILK